MDGNYYKPQQVAVRSDNVAVSPTAVTSKMFVKNLLDDSVDMNATVSSKLNELSMQERTTRIHELHGVAEEPVRETSEMIQAKVNEVNEALSTFRKEDIVAYQLASEKNKKYVDGIKLLCLRADQFNGKRAAVRLVSYFTFKQGLFGDESLARDITLADLNDEDKQGMNNGIIQLLPEKDRAGRSILMAITQGQRQQYKTETWCRILLFMTTVALRDADIQTKGLVFTTFALGQAQNGSGRPEGIFASVWSLLPARLVGMHYCYDIRDVGMNEHVLRASRAMESRHLCRFRAHSGSYLQCAYSLMTFGIPKHVLPLDMETGEVTVTAHRKWLDTIKETTTTTTTTTTSTQKIEEEEGAAVPRPASTIAAAAAKPHANNPQKVTPSFAVTAPAAAATKENEEDDQTILTPGPMDIVTGRGRHGKTSKGYLKFRKLLEVNRENYDSVGRHSKMVVAHCVLTELRNSGCRFLKSTSLGCFELCNEEEARGKIAHAFRNMRLVGAAATSTKPKKKSTISKAAKQAATTK